MTYNIIFDIIGSDINHIERHKLFDGWVDGALDKDNPNAYAEYVRFLANPVFDWCEENNITDFKAECGPYAMQITFVFNEIEDATAFKLKWYHDRCSME